MTEQSIDVSVIVPTFNRQDLLLRCLQALADLHPETQSRIEVLIVNNGCTDGSEAVINSFCQRRQGWRQLYEKQQGASFARNHGAEVAAGKWLAFLDDDSLVPPDWLKSLLTVINAFPDSAAFGGPYSFYATTPVPDWFRAAFASWNPRGQNPRPFQGREAFVANNLVIDRKTFLEIGGFATHLGPSGKTRRFADDTDLYLRLCSRGHRSLYVPAMKIQHAAKDFQLSIGFLIREQYEVGRAAAQVGLYPHHFLWSLIRLLGTIALAPANALINLDPNPISRFLYAALPIARRCGEFRGRLRTD